MTFETFRDAWWERERREDALRRAGVWPNGEQMVGCSPDGKRAVYRYVGPPLVLTPELVIERAWLATVQARATAWATMLLCRALEVGRDRRSDAHLAQIERALKHVPTLDPAILAERLGLPVDSMRSP